MFQKTIVIAKRITIKNEEESVTRQVGVSESEDQRVEEEDATLASRNKKVRTYI